MIRTNLLATSALRPLVFAGAAFALATAVNAQEVASEDDNTQTLQSEVEVESGNDVNAAADEGIVVTGSRIRRPNLESTVPVTSVGGQEFFETGKTSIGDVLNDLPALASTFSQANSTRFLGTAGLNLLDLRGLGTVRTLVLVNGRRHVASDILSNASSPDTNTIPTDLIERVDVVTGGNSAIYGSDAIAGVVNFVLKDDFEGLQVRGQGGTSRYGDAGSYYVSALAGKNFADGRGNVALNAEYAHQSQYFASSRPSMKRQQGFVVVDTDTAANPNDGNPDRVFYNDIRNATYSNGGTFWGESDEAGFVVPYIFQPDGTLIRQTGTRIGRPATGAFLGGNGNNFREADGTELSPNIDRYSLNLIGHFEVSEAFVPFIEAKYVQTKTRGSGNSGPFFYNGGITGDARETLRTDNPFLSSQALAIIREAYGDFYDADGEENPDGINDADQFGFTIQQNATGFGNRTEAAKRETYRIVAGARGTFNDDWSYEVSANYGHFNEETAIQGNVNVQRFLLALDSARDPVTRNIVCRSQIDPTAATSYFEIPLGVQNLANDVAECAPINPFGEGNVSREAREYVAQDTVAKGRITQLVLSGYLAGDTSEWFELPGGPVGLAVGAEYRRETARYEQDPLVAAGLTFYNVIPTFDPPAFEVKELFGELRFPILSNQPFFEELTLSAAGRVADYKGATGTVFAYNAGLDWSPIQDVRFRGNYSRAVRAPNLVDLYTPLGQNYAPGFADPCALRNIGAGSSTREANCRAAGVPATFDYEYTSSLELQSGGNPDLEAETSDSFTVGGVFQPRAVPGLSLSVDYYDITVKNTISSPSPQAIVDSCYDAQSTDNFFCTLFERDATGRIVEGSLEQRLFNYAKLKVRGIDVEAAYRRNIDSIGTVQTRLTYTRALQNDQFLFLDDPDYADQVLLELGNPKDAFNWDLSVQNGPVTFGYQMRYIGKMLVSAYEDWFSKQGRDPENADWADRKYYGDVFYHDIRVAYDVDENMNFYMGVDNIGNRMPPLGSTGIGGGSAIWSNIGRFFYAGAVAKF